MDIKEYNQEFNNKKINIKLIEILIMIFIISITMFLVFKGNLISIKKYNLYVEDSNKISTLVNIIDLNKIVNNKELKIERTTFSYDIEKIEDENFINGNQIYKKLYLKIDLKDKNIKNNYIEYSIEEDKINIIEYFIKIIKGE